MDNLSWLLFSTVSVVMIARSQITGHVEEGRMTAMNETYCNGKGYNDAEEIQLTPGQDWHVGWSGYGIGEGDFCGVSFSGIKDNATVTADRELCVTPEVFDITDCGVTVEYYAIEKVFGGKPSKKYNCTNKPVDTFCTTKPILRIIVESLKDSTSNFLLHVDSPQNAGYRQYSSFTVAVTLVLMTYYTLI